MSIKIILKNSLKIFAASMLLGGFFNKPAESSTRFTACAPSGTVADLSAEADPCYFTPEMLKITFYEVGFCTSDPLASNTFDSSSCFRSWSNPSGFETDLGLKKFENMDGTVYRIADGTYTHAYVIMNPTWVYKASYSFNNGTTWYTKTGPQGGDERTTNISEYGTWTKRITCQTGEEGGNNCADYRNTTTYGPVKSLLTDSNFNTCRSEKECATSTRLVGALSMNNNLVVDPSVRGYKLKWIITNMGIGVYHNGGLPGGFTAGPFVPDFTLIK
tara:strand:+ start:442 stop:1263 length:822 start_codon:yes stop_codon:yes gene_type:complete